MIYKPPPLKDQLPRTGKGFSGPNSLYDEFRQLLYDIVEDQQPMTVRQVFYRAVVKGYVEKTEQGYGFVQQDLVKLRRSGKMEYEWIIDSSRNSRGGQGFRNETAQEYLDRELKRIPDGYFWNLLAEHDFSIQVWLEKEALAEVLGSDCGTWNVPLYPARGYSSLTFLYDAAQDLERKDRPAKIFHFGDYDPSGQDAIRAAQETLEELAPITANHGIEFHIVAVTPEQIRQMNLPTRPTKRSDPRSKSFGDESVELDAIEPRVLRQMVNGTLRRCFPRNALQEKRRKQEEARAEIGEKLAEIMSGDGDNAE